MDNGEFVMRDCYAFDSRWRVTKGTEGVGFEPTVGFPTLDFESSALNRTQPPFPFAKKTSNGQRPTSSVQRKYHADDPVCGKAGPRAWRVPSRAVRALADGFFGLTGPKNVTIFGLPCVPSLLHLVCPHGQPRYYLLLTGINRFLAPLFTSIPSLFENLNPPISP